MSQSPDKSDATPAPMVIPYATPTYLRNEPGFYRNGDLVAVDRSHPAAPDFCFKCGKPATMTSRETVGKQAMISGFNDVTLAFPLCARHGMRLLRITRFAKISKWSILGCFIASILTGSLSFNLSISFIIVGCLMIYVSIAFRFLSFRTARAIEIGPRYILLKGAGKEFLDKLPEI